MEKPGVRRYLVTPRLLTFPHPFARNYSKDNVIGDLVSEEKKNCFVKRRGIWFQKKMCCVSGKVKH